MTPDRMDPWKPETAHTTVEVIREVAVITINRPEKLNALTAPMRRDLAAALRRFGDGSRARGVVLTGSGRAFCSGADLCSLVDEATESIEASIELFHDITRAALQTTVPLVAAINGLAVGGGCELTLCFDARIGTAAAGFLLPENDLGVPISNAASMLLFRLMRGAHAVRLVLDARRTTAVEALEIGLLDEIVDAPELLDAAIELASCWGASGKATAEHLRLLRPPLEVVESAMRRETAAARRTWETGTLAAGADRFWEGRAARR
jgi:enoyl-CoA hydratase/carnithine racemase